MIFLVRHGETDWNRNHLIQGQKSDIPLNETGRMQALERSRVFDGAKFSAVLTSPLKRAYQTARILTRKADVGEFLVDRRFIERDYGPFEGTKSEAKAFSYYFQNTMQGAEDAEDLYRRIFAGIRDVGERYKGNVLITSHGGISGSYLWHQLGREDFKLMNLATIAIDPETGKLVDYNLDSEEIKKYLV